MLTVLLWITLIAAVIALVVLAAPIRFGASALYRENGEEAHTWSWWVSYVHPWVASVRYSSEGESRSVIFGIKNKSDDTDNAGINTDNVGINTDTDNAGADGVDTDGINTDNAGINTDNADINTDKAGINTDTDNAGADGVDTDDINTDNAGINTDTDDGGINTDSEKINTDKTDTAANINKDQKKSKPQSFMSSIKSHINSIKSHKAYKIISNKPLRKKSLRWLRLTAISLVRMVSFEKFTLRARVGLRDPAALGRLYGYFSAVREAVPLRDYPAVDVGFEPVFTERCLDVEAEAAGRTTVSVLLWNLGVVVATFPYFRVYWAVAMKGKPKDLKSNSNSNSTAKSTSYVTSQQANGSQ